MIVLVDDLRSFRDKRECVVLRTSQDALTWLQAHRDERIDELWLDHDLGLHSKADIGTVVAELEQAAVDDEPYDVGVIHVHSANPAGRQTMLLALTRRGYRVIWSQSSAYAGVFTTR